MSSDTGWDPADGAGLEALYREHSTWLVRRLRRVLGRHADAAEDIAQDAYMRIARYATDDAGRHPRALLGTVGVNLSYDYMRRVGRAQRFAEDSARMAKAVVRLATRPRNLTAVGAPAIAFKLGEFAAPNLLTAIMSGFLDTWSARAADGNDSDGVLFEHGVPAGPDGGRRDPHRGRKVAAAAGGAAMLGLAGIGIWLGRRR